MKKFYLQILFLCFGVVAFAQSPIFEITAPASLAGGLFFGASVSPAQASSTSPSWGYQLKSLTDNVAGDVAIAVDSTMTDSTKRLENCTLKGTSMSVKGKWALVRRGTCSFSPKAYNAQKAGAIGVIMYSQETQATQIITMAAADSAAAITVPVLIISYTDAQKMVKSINAGTKVSVNYRYTTLFNPGLYYNYATPLKEIVALDQLQISASKNFKATATDTASTTKVQFKVVEPDGVVKTSGLLAGVVGTDPNLVDTTLRTWAFPSYKPTKVGKHQVSFINNKNNDIFQDSFVITNYTFAQDQQVADNYTATDSATFNLGGLILDVGHVIYTGINADKATHGIFSIYNSKSIPAGDAFTFQVFEMTSALLAKFPSTLTYDDLNSTKLTTSQYIMTGKETSGKTDSLLTIEFKTPITLKDTSVYLIMIRYDGSTSGNTKCPQYLSAGSNPSSFGFDDAVFAYSATNKANRFYSGWSGQPKNVVRLAMAGFAPGKIDTKLLDAWAENQVTVFPNPVKDVLTLNFDLQTLNPTVDVLITNSSGVEVQSGQFKNVQTGTQTINVGGLANGLYFARLMGTDGWRTKAFVVSK